MVRDNIEILLVEDNPNNVALTTRALSSGNITNHVRVARDGEEALGLFFGNGGLADRNKYSCIVLLDQKLPKVGGLEVLQKLKSDPRTQPFRLWCPRRRVKSPTSRPRTNSAPIVTSSNR